METTFSLPTADDHRIYGTCNSVSSSKAIILVHGLTGYQHEQHYMRAIPFFNAAGFDVVRFNFYSDQPKARTLADSSIPLQTEDLNTVIEHFNQQYEELYVVGHNLAGPVILGADQSLVSRLVLWDPTSGVPSAEALVAKGCVYDERIDRYVFNSIGRDILLGQAMVDSWIAAADVNRYAAMAAKPLKVIFAGEDTNKDIWIPYLDTLEVEHKYTIIAGATHGFVEEGTLEKLYEETLSWIAS